jgi:AcrR family transcriptional regulator
LQPHLTRLAFDAQLIGVSPNVDARLSERGRLTRGKLLSAAREVFEQNPYAEVRVDWITKKAAVSHGTFYTYFESLDAIFKVLIDELVLDLFASGHVPHTAGEGPSDRLLAANRQYLQAVSRHSALFFRLHEAAAVDVPIRDRLMHDYEIFYARIAGGLERLQQQGLADAQLPPQVAARALGSMVESFALMWLRHSDLDLESAAAVLTRLWCGAIGLPRLPTLDPDATAS